MFILLLLILDTLKITKKALVLTFKIKSFEFVIFWKCKYKHKSKGGQSL